MIQDLLDTKAGTTTQIYKTPLGNFNYSIQHNRMMSFALCTILGVFLNAVPAMAMSCLEVSTDGSGDCIKVGIDVYTRSFEKSCKQCRFSSRSRVYSSVIAHSKDAGVCVCMCPRDTR